jgi:YD repeat-containing protein
MTRLSRIEDANGNKIVFAYNGSGALVSGTDTLGRVTTYEYGDADTSGGEERIARITNTLGDTATFTYYGE